MTKPVAATLPGTATYDDCRISACLKSLFTIKSKAKADLTIKDTVVDVRHELEQLNKANVLELSYEYLAAMERSIPGATSRYVIIKRNGKPVLFTYFQLFTLTSKNFNLEKNKDFVKRILRFFLDLKKVVVLISGNALRNETAASCFNAELLSKDEATELIASVAEKIASDECVTGLVLKDIPLTAHSHKWFAKEGFETPWADTVMTMDIGEQWASLDDYTAVLSRKYKTRAKKILAAGSELSTRLLSLQEVSDYNSDIFRLFKNVTDKQSFVLTYPEADHFSTLKKIYKDEFEVIGFFKGDELIAFFTAFVGEDDYEIYYAGFDYQLNNDYQLYFNLLFTGLDRAIQLQKKQLKLGRTSFDAKASLGAEPVVMDYFYKPGYIPNVVSKWFANYFSSMEDAKWKLRNPLKAG